MDTLAQRTDQTHDLFEICLVTLCFRGNDQGDSGLVDQYRISLIHDRHMKPPLNLVIAVLTQLITKKIESCLFRCDIRDVTLPCGLAIFA